METVREILGSLCGDSSEDLLGYVGSILDVSLDSLSRDKLRSLSIIFDSFGSFLRDYYLSSCDHVNVRKVRAGVEECMDCGVFRRFIHSIDSGLDVGGYFDDGGYWTEWGIY